MPASHFFTLIYY